MFFIMQLTQKHVCFTFSSYQCNVLIQNALCFVFLYDNSNVDSYRRQFMISLMLILTGGLEVKASRNDGSQGAVISAPTMLPKGP